MVSTSIIKILYVITKKTKISSLYMFALFMSNAIETKSMPFKRLLLKKNRKILCTQYGNGKWRKIQCIHTIPHIVCYNVIVKFKSIFLDFVQASQCERQQHWDVMMIKRKTNKRTSNGIFKYKWTMIEMIARVWHTLNGEKII